MRRLLIHGLIAIVAAFIAYKILIALCSPLIPGQPFYGFHFRDWVDWVFSPHDFLFIAAATVAEFAILWFVLRKWLRSETSVAVWGAAFGVYVGVVSYPLDLVSRVDRYGPQHGTLSALITVVEVVLIGVVVPALIAAAIGKLVRRSSYSDA